MAKRKAKKIWVYRSSGHGHNCSVFTQEPMEMFRDFGNDHVGYWGKINDDPLWLCGRGTKILENLLGEQLPPWPLLAEIEVPPFRITKVWEPVE